MTSLILPSHATVQATQGHFDVHSTSPEPVLTSLGSSPLAQLLSPEQLRDIAAEAALCDNLTQCRWNFWVTPGGRGVAVGSTAGRASWLGIRASRQGDQLTVEWRSLDAMVQFTQPSSQVQHESRGRRRYGGACGPRKKHTWTELIPRGLTPDEITTVKDFLEAAVRAQPLFLN